MFVHVLNYTCTAAIWGVLQGRWLAAGRCSGMAWRAVEQVGSPCVEGLLGSEVACPAQSSAGCRLAQMLPSWKVDFALHVVWTWPCLCPCLCPSGWSSL